MPPPHVAILTTFCDYFSHYAIFYKNIMTVSLSCFPNMQSDPKRQHKSPIRKIYNPFYTETKPEAENKQLQIYKTPAGLLPQLPGINIPELTAASMDRLARKVFAGAFIIFNIFYWTYYM